MQLDAANGGPPWTIAVQNLREKWVGEWVGRHRDFFCQKMPLCERGLLVAPARGSMWLDAGPASDEAWEWIEVTRPQSLRTMDMARVLGSERMASVPCLDLTDKPLGLAGVRKVFSSYRVASTRRLRLQLGADHLGEMARRLRPGLAELDLSVYYTFLDHVETGMPALFRHEGAASLRSLSLALRADTSDEIAAALADAPPMQGLRRLSLDGTTMTDEGFAAVARLPLRRLAIDGAHFDLGALLRLRDAACGATLEELRLGKCGRGRKPELTIALPRLRRLELLKTALLGAGTAMLAQSGMLEKLDVLDLSGNAIGGEGIAAIAANVSQGPRTLRLAGCNLPDAALARLADWPGLSRVRFLDVSGNRLSDKGLRALAESPRAASLEALFLAGNRNIGAMAITDLLRSPLGSRLRCLRIDQARTSVDTAALATCSSPALRELGLGADAIRRRRTMGLAPAAQGVPQLRHRMTSRLAAAHPSGRCFALSRTGSRLAFIRRFSSSTASENAMAK